MLNWTPPDHWLRITSIDAHTGGEPLRIVTSGFPDLPGNTILEKRQYARTHYDHLRRALMWEPRGHADMYGAILTPPVTDDGDIGVLFMHNEGFSTMCGHGIIGLVKVGVQTGMFPAAGDETVVKIDTPAGRVTATAHLQNGQVKRVSFLNVPSFLFAQDLTIHVDGLGSITYDIAFGGAFYAYVDVDQPALAGVVIDDKHQNQLIDVGMRIKRAVMNSVTLRHPTGDDDLNFLYGTILVKMLHAEDVQSRNVCVFAEGEVDRSPTGTGVSGRLAIHHAKGDLTLEETITIESLIGSRFTGRVAETVEVGGFAGIIPEVAGTAYITGQHTFLIDPDDPLRDGFILR
ncbi:MAG: proline racemase family protein [Chloroflexi bacterium]|nr:proline racemase family protein [Chloroflexota bacterium]MCC6892560.1 proline racemase family protein [Anaerolineae bacterium]